MEVLKIWDIFIQRRLQTTYVPNIMPLGPSIKELKRFEDSRPYQNSSFQEGPKFSSSIKCRFNQDWQLWLCKFLLSTAHYSEILVTMHLWVGFYQSKYENFINTYIFSQWDHFQTVRPIDANIDNGPTSLVEHYISPILIMAPHHY